MAEDNWTEIIVHVKKPSDWETKRKLVLGFVKPTLEELWKGKAVQFFHYFFEPELHLRLFPNKEKGKAIESVITKNLKPFEKDFLSPPRFNDYQGEYESFLKNTGNKNSWYLGRDFFTENSGTATHFLEMLDRDTLFSPTNWMLDRFLHSFCNELGFSNEEEGRILFQYAIHRATIEKRLQNDREGTKRVLQKLRHELEKLTVEFLK
jgi:hypothetical protein